MPLINRLVFICCMIFLCCGLALADEEIHEFKVRGEGASYRDALQNALMNGISQQYGFKLKSQQRRQTKIREVSAYINDQAKSMGEIDISSQGRIDFKTEGFVQNYEVLSKSINSSDLFEVVVLIKVAKYKTPGISPHNRRKIAIIPFHITKASYDFGGRNVSSSEVARQFTQKIVTEMTQTRKFTVLDREYMGEFLKERNLLLSADAPIAEQMKIGEALGVDYLVIGTLSEAGQKQEPYTIQVSGENGYDYSASLKADYRIMVMATRQIKWSDSVVLSLDNNEIRTMVPSLNPSQIQQTLLDKAAKQMVHKAMDNIYPLRVVKVQPNGEVLLNQGGAGLAQGDVLDVFRKGERVVDPYTGESLGAAESWVATIKITRVIPKMSYASLVKGDLPGIANGSICRRVEMGNLASLQESGRTTDVRSTSAGGVVLPFD